MVVWRRLLLEETKDATVSIGNGGMGVVVLFLFHDSLLSGWFVVVIVVVVYGFEDDFLGGDVRLGRPPQDVLVETIRGRQIPQSHE